MAGYLAMAEQIQPEAVICYGEPFSDMRSYADLLVVEYSANTRVSYMVED
jgi:3-methyladenine DNA glycosylase/8-oxoguanine DNA glycosylase